MTQFQSITHLKIGDKAPTIKAIDHQGLPFALKDLLGKRVALYFYPNDDTPTCTKEACNLRDHYSILQQAGFEIIGVSQGTVASKKKFVLKYQLPFKLLADPDRTIALAYGVYGDKLFMGKISTSIHRVTFIISPKGIIERIIHKVTSANAHQQILEQ